MSKVLQAMIRILLIIFISLLSFYEVVYADEFPPARWVCAASELTSDGINKEVLNVIFIPDGVNKAVVYANNECRVRFERYQNPLDNTWEIALSLNSSNNDQEIFRVYAEEDQSMGFKKIDLGIGAYCRSKPR